ncbi:MAG: hypothetical protein RIK87_12465 [Fuerstiella sp.]
MTKLVLCSLLSCQLILPCALSAAAEDPPDAALQLFEDRIMPIFRSPRPSSCVQCHLSSVDIKNYILPSHTETFVALREQGLVDVDAPEKSKILTLIRMGDKDADRTAQRLHEKTRQAEFEAFSSWIKACCQNPELRTLTLTKAATVGPDKPVEVVRHARKSRVVESFARNIWSQRMRCFPCHTPHELDADNPKHQAMIKKQAEFVKEFGLKMNIFQQTPEATLGQLIASSRRRIPGRYPLINLDDPSKSLLILKPTAKLPSKDDDGNFARPSSTDPVSHMGGLKIHVNDQSYKSFMTWIQDYANVVGGTYSSVDELPADNWVPTQRVLRMKDVPEAWGDLTTVQLFVHARTADDTSWSAEPIAFTQSLITPRRMVNGPLFLLRAEAPFTADESETGADQPDALDADAFPLQPGRYLVRVCVDARQRLDQDPSLLLGADDFVGAAEITAHWQIGFPKAETFSATDLQK